MVITSLVENSRVSEEFNKKHGLSIHIKTENNNILFDLGPDDTFIKNAKKLNINLREVDIVIISHGHKDHGGGLEAFLEINDKANIYINKSGFKDYYVSILKYIKIYVGLDKSLESNERIVLTDGLYTINDNLRLISNIKGNVLKPRSNNNLYVKEGLDYKLDDFKHEQHLVLNEVDKNILISGCSHSGILNILNYIEDRLNLKIDFVLGGLHLFNPVNKKTENLDFVSELGKELNKRDIKIYTCHCTGKKSYKILKGILDKKIENLKTGDVVVIKK